MTYGTTYNSLTDAPSIISIMVKSCSILWVGWAEDGKLKSRLEWPKATLLYAGSVLMLQLGLMTGNGWVIHSFPFQEWLRNGRFYGDLGNGLSLELTLLVDQLSLSSSDFWTGEIFSHWYVYYSLCEQDGEN